MEERYIELKFYLFISHLLKKFKYSIHILDVVEAYCLLGDINSAIIKKLIKQIKDNCGPICTYRDEIVYVFSTMGYSFRQIYDLTGVSTGTQARVHKYLAEHPEVFKDLGPHLNSQEYNEVYKFVKVTDIMKGIKNG